MQKSIFRRYLGISMAIVILSFALLGGMVLGFFSRSWHMDQRQQLVEHAVYLAESFQEEQTADGQTASLLWQARVDSVARGAGVSVYVTGPDGRVSLRSENSGGESLETVPPEVMERVAAGRYEARTAWAGLPGKRDVVGAPIYVRDTAYRLGGAVFVAGDGAALALMRWELLRIFLLAAAIALTVTFLLVGLFAYRQVRPLRQMAAAARYLAKGDFSVRVPVTSADELGQLAEAFNNMANSLAISEGTRRSFIANVSHELKTPMTTIAGFIDGILDGTIPREEQDKYLGVVSSEVKRLSRLVRSMLDLSRIDNGELKLSPTSFDITETIVSTLLTFEQPINEKRIEVRGLEDAAPTLVYGDQDLLHQVVYNLLENAVKFTNEGGWIAVQVTDSIDRTTVVIENSGEGIDREEMPHIFERFYKTDKSRSRDKNGMGLGLYIVQTILKLHGGDISASSVTGESCRFEFTVPKPRDLPPAREQKTRSKSKKKQ